MSNKIMTKNNNTPVEQHLSDAGVSYSEIIKLTLIAVAYFVAARVGLLFVVHPEGLASVWPPSGVAIAALILTERRKWFSVFFVLFITNMAGNLTGGNTLSVSTGFALANITESALGAWVIIHVCGPKVTFEKTVDIIALYGTSVIGNGFTALFGAAVPSFAFGAPYFDTWFIWWVADGLGILLITPVIITWATRPIPAFNWKRFAEGATLLVSTMFLAWLLFNPSTSNEYPLVQVYIFFPLLIWAALRFSPRFTATLILVFAIITVWQTVHSHNELTFADHHLKSNLLSTQLPIFIATFSSMILATVVTERRLSEKTLKHSKELSESILNSINDAVCLINIEDLSIIDANETFVKQYGFSKDIFGRNCYEVTHNRQEPCCPPHDICPLKETLQESRTAHAEHVHFLPDGSKTFVEIITSPSIDENGKVKQVVQVSSPGESHPQALSEPDVNLSAHPAPIVQPEVAFPALANEQTSGVVEELSGQASALLFSADLSNP